MFIQGNMVGITSSDCCSGRAGKFGRQDDFNFIAMNVQKWRRKNFMVVFVRYFGIRNRYKRSGLGKVIR
jgi:hypothetical protein